MPSHTPIPLTLLEKAHLALTLTLGLIHTLLLLLLHPLTTLSSPRKSARRAFLRSTLRILPPGYIPRLMNPTGRAVAQVARRHHLPHTQVSVAAEGFPRATVHFITPKITSTPPNTTSRTTATASAEGEAPKGVLLYAHGGGYLIPASILEIEAALSYASHLKSTLAILEYTLAPSLPYPGQLAQGVAAVAHLLGSYAPSDIFLGGLSAGGNLVLGILAHLQQPLEGVENVEMVGKFGGMFCLSPRCAVETSSQSFDRFARVDLMTRPAVAQIMRAWKPVDEVWAGATRGDATFWKNLKIERGLMCVGGQECYQDDVVKLGVILEEGNPGVVKTVVCDGEIHGELREEGMVRVLEAWLDCL